MASSPTHPQSPPRKRAKLSLKLMRKEQLPPCTVSTVPEEPAEPSDKQSNSDALNDTQPIYPEASEPQPSSSCIPSEYVISVAPYTGLHNLGNTCYLNSVLQVLRYCPGFAENLDRLSEVVSTVLKVKEEEDADEAGQGDERSRRRRKEFINQLRLVHKLNKLFKTMSDKEQSYLERMMPSGHELAMYPEDILEAIRDLNPMFKGYLQHDAQELLCCILSNVQEACQGMYANQQPAQEGVNGMSANSLTADPSTSDQSMKAVRKLDMGAGGDGAPAEEKMDCGKLLGGGRSRSSKGFSHQKLVQEDGTNGGLVKHKETEDNKGLTNGHINGHMNGDHSENLCNGTDVKPKKGVGMLKGSQVGAISPSNDSVRRRGARKSSLTNGHLSSKESNGLDAAETCPTENGAGDAGSSKKKRLGMGRFMTLHQTSLLSKFGILKKEKSQSVDDEEPKDSNGIDQAKHDDDDIQLETDSSSSEAVKSRNTTSNNSNSPDLSLNLTCESVHVDSQSAKAIKGMKIEPDTKESETSSIKTEKEEDMEVAEAAVIESAPDDEELAQPLEDKSSQPTQDNSAVDVSTLSVAAEDSDMKLVETMFQGTLALRTRCLECESCSEKREDFQDVSVPVQSIPVSSNDDDQEDPTPDVNPRNLSLSWALSEFTSVERLTDDNKYFCDHCFQKTEAERSVLFGRLPGVLIIQLKRFSAFINCFSPGGSVSKVNDHLAIPLTLSLARWCSQTCQEKNRTFELSAIVAHSGSSSSSGHYVAFTRVPQRNAGSFNEATSSTDQRAGDAWANFDDDRVNLMNEDDFASFLNPLPGNDTSATPYLLMYRQLPSTETS